MTFNTRLLTGTIEEREAEREEGRSNELTDVTRWDRRFKVQEKCLYFYESAKQEHCIGWIKLETFNANCGMCLSWGLCDRDGNINKKRLNVLMEAFEGAVKKAHHGIMIYGLNEDQDILEGVLKSRGFVETVAFKSPRTANICKLLVKDLTK